MKKNITEYKHHRLIIISVFCFISCTAGSNNTNLVSKDSSLQKINTDTPFIANAVESNTTDDINTDSTYAYIRDITQKGDSVFITADYIQFLTGKEALAAAKQHHEADTMYDAKGKITEIIVDNDYYIVNDNKKLRILPLAKDVTIETVSVSNGPVKIVATSLKDFIRKHKKDSFPFILKFKNNEVSKIIEVYVP